MKDLPEAVDHRPDPASVFTLADLAIELSALRDRGPDRLPRRRLSLSTVSAITEIPRSTVHSYLSGSVMPDAPTLDAIVLALGCGSDQAGAWAEAWERVAITARGSRSSSRVFVGSRFAMREQQSRADVRGDAGPAVECAVPAAISERVVIGSTRQIDQIQFRMSVRAVVDGADRYVLRFPPGNSSLPDPSRLQIGAVRHCIPGDHRTGHAGVRILEVLFGQVMRAGETHAFDFTLDLANARSHCDNAGDRTYQATRGFKRQGPPYALEVSFAPDANPHDLQQVHQGDPAGPTNVIGHLRLNSWRSVAITIDKPAAGLHGIAWTW